MFELVVYKGTTDGGGNTFARECIFSTGTETDEAELCNSKKAYTAKLKHIRCP